MNYALIIAGGSGNRMGQDIPKQFINVYDKPVLIYTLESFQRHPMIDALEVVCRDGWHDVLRAYAVYFLHKSCLAPQPQPKERFSVHSPYPNPSPLRKT